MHVDGSSNYKGSRDGLVLITPDGSMLEQVITLGLKASNNEAEYETLLADIQMEQGLAVKKLTIHSNSQLITSQTTTLTQVPRAYNAHVDAMAALGSALDY